MKSIKTNRISSMQTYEPELLIFFIEKEKKSIKDEMGKEIVNGWSESEIYGTEVLNKRIEEITNKIMNDRFNAIFGELPDYAFKSWDKEYQTYLENLKNMPNENLKKYKEYCEKYREYKANSDF